MEKNSTKSAIIKSVVLVLLGMVIILGLYLLLTRGKKPAKEENYDMTVVDEITTTNLEKNYPANPKKVVELYAKTMQVLYKETYTDEQENKMIEVLRGIMDDELLANQVDFAAGIRKEVKERKEGDYSISTYVVQTEEPDVVKVQDRKMCNVDCLFSLRKGTGHIAIYYQFVMRQDDSGKWKILGWTMKQDK